MEGFASPPKIRQRVGIDKEIEIHSGVGADWEISGKMPTSETESGMIPRDPDLLACLIHSRL